MSYQVLARKWRPAKFAELVGQEHVKAALINGLTNQRLHHAYLFTGTRGVGKTTIARIFAKSLNCETGISAEPCGQCGTCLDVDAGRFVDLIEIDAASKTKVGDTREILDNVQYAPTRGRYKVYLIDEVHMLSRHSFNALLKTLEEPPEHVKFLLATTDPQKLPVTILSRCLQFNLQALSIKQISEQLEKIMMAEQLPFELQALELLAKYAKGSMRDGLSLTDQAIAQSGQNVTLDVVQQMMGTVDISWSQNILTAILTSDPKELVGEFSRLTKQNPDIDKVLDDLLSVCHQIALTQIVPNAASLNQSISEFIQTVANQLTPQEVQVYYQILLQGKRDLKVSSDPYSAFEMVCLRLLAFKPVCEFSELPVKKNTELKLVSHSSTASEKIASIATDTLDTSKDPESVLTTNDKDKAAVERNSHDGIQTNTQSEATEQDPELKEAAPQTQATVAVEPNLKVSSSFDQEEQVPTESELLAQQNFYQDIAQSQGFSPQTNATESNPSDQQQEHINSSANSANDQDVDQSSLVSNMDIEPVKFNELESMPNTSGTVTEFDSPVMAILAARGFDNNLNQQLSDSIATQSAPSSPIQTDVNHSTEAAETELEPEIEPEPKLMPLEHEEVRFAHQVDKWASLIERSDLAGRARQLALNGSVDVTENRIELVVKQEFAHLLNEKTEAELTDVVLRLAPECEFIINKSELVEYAPAEIQKDINQNRQERAEQSIHSDAMVQTLLQQFDGKIVEGSIKPL